MAVFVNKNSHADDAVSIAVTIISKLNDLNKSGTVISDTVNLASRIEGLTKKYHYPILISKECYKSMKHPERYIIKHIADITVRGKTKNVHLCCRC